MEVFDGCAERTGIVFAEGLTLLPDKAFIGCEKLESLTLPKSLKTVNRLAFSGCPELKLITYAGTAEDWAKIRISADAEEALKSCTILFEGE